MAAAPVAADFHQAFDIERNFAAKVAFDDDVLIDEVTKLHNFVLREVAGTGIRIYARRFQKLLGGRKTDSVDIC